MDSYYKKGTHTNSDKNVQNASRVYINPNFQRISTPVPQNGSMYLNPQFHKNTPHLNLQSSSINKPKIYVNPNFVRTTTPMLSVSIPYSIPVAATMNSYNGIPSANQASKKQNNPSISTPMLGNSYSLASRSTLNTYYVNSRISTVTGTDSLHLPNVTSKIIPQNTKPEAVARSRYSLIRQKNADQNVGSHNTDKIVTKMKISKYKTVSLEHVKKMQTQKEELVPKTLPPTNIPVVAEKTKRIIKADFTKSRFKLVKNNMGTRAMKVEFKTPIKRRSLNSSKVVLGSSQKLKIRVEITKFKKNNIPCPLFRKYGTCLRNSRGKCEFLHDKKHVSICRKFLKGVCHDKNCLLSHEITAEKMPTCSFYLKGMCTREDCRYLHVKLNEKTKICLDFLKGYCEKGDKCLNRHVYICPDQAMKGQCLKKGCPYPHRINKKNIPVNKVNSRKFYKSIKSITNNKIDKKAEIPDNSNQTSNEVEVNKDCRYYREVVEDSSPVEVEVIKPTRCKLGALPSFIQL